MNDNNNYNNNNSGTTRFIRTRLYIRRKILATGPNDGWEKRNEW